MGGVHILAGVRESNPYTVHMGAAGQLDPNAIVTFVGVQRRVAIRGQSDGRGDLDEVSIAEGVPALLAVSCTHFLRGEKRTGLRGGGVYLLHDELAQLNIIPSTVEQVVVSQLIDDEYHIGSHLGPLDLHSSTKQQGLFDRHVFKSAFQPVMLGAGHFKTVQ